MSINADTILTICSIITSVAGACAVITNVIKKQLAKLTDKVKEETINEINNDIHTYDIRTPRNMKEFIGELQSAKVLYPNDGKAKRPWPGSLVLRWKWQ